MTRQQREGGGEIADIEGADYTVYTCGCYYAVAVFVPVVGESFGGGEGWAWAVGTDGTDAGLFL